MKLVALALAAVLSLAACGPKSESGSGDKPAVYYSTGKHDASGTISEAKLGLKFYPGARIVTSGETNEVVTADFQTSDPLAKVSEFYQKELDPEGLPGAAHVTGTKNGRLYVVSLAPSGSGTTISIMGKK